MGCKNPVSSHQSETRRGDDQWVYLCPSMRKLERKSHSSTWATTSRKPKGTFGLDDSQVEKAEQEYRHFFICFSGIAMKAMNSPLCRPKGRHLWHAHLLFNAEYNAFCLDLYGEIIAHRPGLEEGTDPFIIAVLHTKELHDRVGDDGFDKGYFSYVERERPSEKKGDTGSGTHAAGGCGGETASKAPAADADGSASCCGSSCGSSCGGVVAAADVADNIPHSKIMGLLDFGWVSSFFHH